MMSPRKVQRMKKAELLQLATDLGCELSPNALRPDVIAACLAKLPAEESATSPQQSHEPGNRELFNQLTADTAEQQSTHGGARPGAGRKPGKSNDECRIDNLPAEPNRTVKDFYKWLFRIWARFADYKEIELDKDELDELALDTTRFLEYHGIKIPQGLSVDTRFIISNCEAVGTRLAMHQAHKARLKEKEQEIKENDKRQQQNTGDIR